MTAVAALEVSGVTSLSPKIANRAYAIRGINGDFTTGASTPERRWVVYSLLRKREADPATENILHGVRFGGSCTMRTCYRPMVLATQTIPGEGQISGSRLGPQ